MLNWKHVLSAFLLVFCAACAGSHSGPVLCTARDGAGLAAGEAVPGDACQVCDATAGSILPRWGDGCGTTADHSYSPLDLNLGGGILKVGGDVDGDGVSDVSVSHQSELTGNPSYLYWGSVNVFSLKAGDNLYRLDGTPEHPVGGPLDLGGDVDGDGKADLLFAETYGWFAGAKDVDGGADEPHGAPNVIHLRSMASGEDIWTLNGPGGCHALGKEGRFVRDYDGDGRPDVVLLDPGCVRGHTAPGMNFGPTETDLGGSLELHSGSDGSLIRSWSQPHGVGIWGTRGVYLAPDQDGDGKDEILVYSSDSVSGSPEVQVFSVQSDPPIARWYMDVDPSGRTYLAADLTGDGEVTVVGIQGMDDGQIALSFQSHLSSPSPTVRTIDFRIPGGSRTWHDVSYYGHADVDGDGSQDIIFRDHDSGRDDPSLVRLVAVSLEGRVLWVSPNPSWRDARIGNGATDLDHDGRVDFVTLGQRTDSLHLDLSSGFSP